MPTAFCRQISDGNSPRGGVRGGEVVAQGTPEDVARVEGSFTGAYLAPMLERQKEAAA